MKIIHKKSLQSWRAALFAFICISFLYIGLSHVLADDKAIFLNDRAADIINARPLSFSDFLVPEGLTGKGQIVGIADSGLDKGSISDIHPDLQSEPGKMPRLIMLKSYSGRAVPDDPLGHGTHMASTIVGSGADSEGKYQGIAPGASLYFQALLDSNGSLKIPDKIDDLFSPAYQAGVKVHVNGWGRSGNQYAAVSAQIDDFVYRYPDFLPVFGAGNSGPGAFTLTSEANSKNALVVGSSQVPRPAFDSESHYADQVTASSSRGPAGDGRIKPELLAPGSAIVSACSSLIESNFTANPSYTLMGGSSMASAVTGGSIALLREYLIDQEMSKNPSAALEKALLVNGARFAEGGPSKETGFGILDLAGTILSLQEKGFLFEDNVRIKDQDTVEYRYTVTDSAEPLKVTLAWTDPPAKTGTASALVNNLDLIVRTPGGRQYLGNDFARENRADDKNNIEQIYIPHPDSGDYVITVRASNMGEQKTSQKYSIVYGQTIRQEIIREVTAGSMLLEDGTSIDLKEINLQRILQDEEAVDIQEILPGSQLYLSAAGNGYIFGSSWESGSTQMIPAQEGNFLVEASDQYREGGYYLNPGTEGETPISVNGNMLEDASLFPTGAGLTASINPVYQTLWQISAVYSEVSGYISSVDVDNGTIKLIHDTAQYQFSPWAAGTLTSVLVDSSSLDAAFGYGEKADLSRLIPGMKVTLMITPGTGWVNYVRVQRELVAGKIAYYNAETETIRMDSGRAFKVFPGTMIYQNGQEREFSQLAEGDYITGLLLPGTEELLQINVCEEVYYGRVIYLNHSDGQLYFLDTENQVQKFPFQRDTEVYHQGVLVDKSNLAPGKWVKIVTAADDEKIERVDIADIEESTESLFSQYDDKTGVLETVDGRRYYLGEDTLLSKGGYQVMPQDLVAGEKVKITTLSAAAPYSSSLAAVEVVSKPGIPTPRLNVNVHSLNGVLIIQGSTDADRITLYRTGKRREVISVGMDGKFSAIFSLQAGENQVRVLALNTRTGGIYSLDKEVIVSTVKEISTFKDIADHPAQAQIEDLVSRGIVRGYEDGTFRPDQPITRVELVKLLVDYKGWQPSGRGVGKYYIDSNDIPWWALGAVTTATEYGIIEGYPDETFRPLEPVSQSEMALIMDRVFNGFEPEDNGPQNTRANDDIPAWARAAVSRGYERGVLQSIWSAFRAAQPVTRGEAAIFLAWL